MQAIAHVALLPNGQVSMKVPPGKDFIWLLGWLDIAKEAIKEQIAAQNQQAIQIPDPDSASQILRNGK